MNADSPSEPVYGPRSKFAKHHALIERLVREYKGKGNHPNYIDWQSAFRDHPEWFATLGIDRPDKRGITGLGWYVRNKILKGEVRRTIIKRPIKRTHPEFPSPELTRHEENLEEEFRKLGASIQTPTPSQPAVTGATSEVRIMLEVTIGVRVVQS